MNKPTIIIDHSAFIHNFKFAMKGLTYSEKKTGVIFGYLNKLVSLGGRFKTNQFVFALDSRKSKRREIYPLYKKKRHEDKTEEEIEEK